MSEPGDDFGFLHPCGMAFVVKEDEAGESLDVRLVRAVSIMEVAHRIAELTK